MSPRDPPIQLDWTLTVLGSIRLIGVLGALAALFIIVTNGGKGWLYGLFFEAVFVGMAVAATYVIRRAKGWRSNSN